MRNHLLCLFLLLFSSSVFAQATDPRDEFGNWNAWMNSLVFSPKWKFDTDFHFRTWQLGKDPNTLILRGGLTYVAKPWLEMQVGYGYFEFYRFGDEFDWKPKTIEHRTHQQAFLKHKIKKFSINHRLRLEERMIKGGADDIVWRYRHRLYIAHPLADKLYAFTSYEHFLLLDGLEFDQGRLHVGLGHPVGKNSKLELAYLYHFLHNDVQYSRFQVNFFTTFKLKHDKEN